MRLKSPKRDIKSHGKHIFKASMPALVMLLLAASAAGEQCIPVPGYVPFDRIPVPGATGVPTTTSISISFIRPLNSTYYLEAEPAINITNVTKEIVGVASEKVTFYPANLLQAGTSYTVTIIWGYGPPVVPRVGDCPIPGNDTWNFTTAGLPAINEGPVLVTSTGNVTRNISPSAMISPSVIQPGSSLNITLTPSPASLFTSYQVNESIPYGFTFVRTSAAYTSQGNVYIFTQNISAPITYTLMASTTNGEYGMFGTFKDALANTGIVSGDSRIWIDVSIASRYAGFDGRIHRSEAIQAVIDYFSGAITRQEAIDVVIAYFSGSVATI